MSKYLDIIGQQISQNQSVTGSKNDDSENDIVVKMKKHGLKVVGGIALAAGSFFTYKHFTKNDDDFVKVDFEQDKKPTKIHDFVDREDADEEGRGQEFDQHLEHLEETTPSMQEFMELADLAEFGVDDFEQDRKPTKIHDFVDREDADEEGRGQEFDQYLEHLEETTPSMQEIMELSVDEKNGSADLEALFDIQVPAEGLELSNNYNVDDSPDLSGSDVFFGGTLKEGMDTSTIEPKFSM